MFNGLQPFDKLRFTPPSPGAPGVPTLIDNFLVLDVMFHP